MIKRIACFVGQILHTFQWEVINGIIAAAEKEGYRVEIFSNFGTFGDNFLHTEGERNFINLPDLKKYHGIIMAPDTFDIVGAYESLCEIIERDAQCPVVSLRYKDDKWYSIVTDDTSAMEGMVEHMITEHGLKRICFMTGRMDLEDAHKRLHGYLNVMGKYGIPIENEMIFQGDYWRNKGEEAVEWFMSGSEYPEAIVCSNDFMAISVCDALINRGIQIPQDVCVSGFDCIDEARYYNPSITGVAVDFYKMGTTAVEIIADVTAGKERDKCTYIGTRINLGGSCGCVKDMSYSMRELYSEKQNLKNAILQTAYLSVDMENCNTIEEIFQVAFKYSVFFNYKALYFCFCEREQDEYEEIGVEERFTDEVVIKAILRDDKDYVFCNERFRREDILPEKFRRGDGPLYNFPLHYKNQCIGYVVLQLERPEEINHFFTSWMLTVANYLDKVRIYNENENLMQFREQSLLDELTGLNNRRGFETVIRQKYALLTQGQKGFFIVSCDMDGLKVINDNYGHLEGDEALKAYARILKSVEKPGVYCARVGGDEFNICFEGDRKGEVDKLVDEIRRQIAEYNESKIKEYQLSASIGYAYCGKKSTLINCMKKADEIMYQEKMKKKSARSFTG